MTSHVIHSRTTKTLLHFLDHCIVSTRSIQTSLYEEWKEKQALYVLSPVLKKQKRHRKQVTALHLWSTDQHNLLLMSILRYNYTRIRQDTNLKQQDVSVLSKCSPHYYTSFLFPFPKPHCGGFDADYVQGSSIKASHPTGQSVPSEAILILSNGYKIKFNSDLFLPRN